jgi:laccase
MAAGLVVFFFAVLLSAAVGGDAAIVEHTFVVNQVRMRHLCNDTLVTVVNGQFPGPALEATEGDTVVVHLVNQSPYGITIHWYVVRAYHACMHELSSSSSLILVGPLTRACNWPTAGTA